MADAACRQVDPELFFPPKGGDWHARQAKAVCGDCPVLADCARHAANLRLSGAPLAGIWAGRSWEKTTLAQAQLIAAVTL